MTARNGKTALPRVVVDYGSLSAGEAQALRDALRAEAKRRKPSALPRCIDVDYPKTPAAAAKKGE